MTETCPYCATAIPPNATVCRGCHAEKAYIVSGGMRYGFMSTLLLGVLLPGMLALIVLAIGVMGRAPMVGLIFAVPFAYPAVRSIIRLKNGPSWWR